MNYCKFLSHTISGALRIARQKTCRRMITSNLRLVSFLAALVISPLSHGLTLSAIGEPVTSEFDIEPFTSKFAFRCTLLYGPVGQVRVHHGYGDTAMECNSGVYSSWNDKGKPLVAANSSTQPARIRLCISEWSQEEWRPVGPELCAEKDIQGITNFCSLDIPDVITLTGLSDGSPETRIPLIRNITGRQSFYISPSKFFGSMGALSNENNDALISYNIIGSGISWIITSWSGSHNSSGVDLILEAINPEQSGGRYSGTIAVTMSCE